MNLFGLPVAATLGGRPLRVAEYRLADVFELEAWARDQAPDPLEVAAFQVFCGPRDAAWKRTLRGVLEASEAAGSGVPSRIATPEGVSRQLFLAARRADPAATPGGVAALMAAGANRPVATRLEVDRILRVAWGTTAEDVVRRFVDGPAPDRGWPDWAEAWRAYVTEAGGAAPRFEDLTISQFRTWAARGKGPDDDRPDAFELAARRGEFWAGLGDDEITS